MLVVLYDRIVQIQGVYDYGISPQLLLIDVMPFY